MYRLDPVSSAFTLLLTAAKAEEKSGLAGGFCVGDRVVSLINLDSAARGDVGTVVGPSDSTRMPDHIHRVSVVFDDDKGRANMNVEVQVVSEAGWPKRQKEDAAKVYAATGWRIGERVRILGRHKGSRIVMGDVGTVVGPGEDFSKTSHELCVDFGKRSSTRLR